MAVPTGHRGLEKQAVGGRIEEKAVRGSTCYPTGGISRPRLTKTEETANGVFGFPRQEASRGRPERDAGEKNRGVGSKTVPFAGGHER